MQIYRMVERSILRPLCAKSKRGNCCRLHVFIFAKEVIQSVVFIFFCEQDILERFWTDLCRISWASYPWDWLEPIHIWEWSGLYIWIMVTNCIASDDFFLCWTAYRWLLSVLWYCWLSDRKGVQHVKYFAIAVPKFASNSHLQPSISTQLSWIMAYRLWTTFLWVFWPDCLEWHAGSLAYLNDFRQLLKTTVFQTISV